MSAAQPTVSQSTTEPRRRHRGRNTLIGLAIFVVLVVIAAIVADGFVRRLEAQSIETSIRSSLAIPATTPVDVNVEGKSAILQYLAGKLKHVEVGVSPVTIAGFSGKAILTANGLSTDASGSVDYAKLIFTTDQDGLKKLIAGITTVKITSVSIASGAVQVGTSVSILGISVPVAAALTPAAVDGKLTLTPRSFVINGATIAAADLKGRFGGIADALTKTQTICVADQLPKAFHLDSVQVRAHSLALGVSAKSFVLDTRLFETKGTC